MLTSKQTKRVEIAHEPGEWAEIRMLSWKQREQATLALEQKAIEQVKAMGASVIDLTRDVTPEEREKARKQREQVAILDPLERYDADTCLKFGLLRLSYHDGKASEVIDDLDGKTAEFLAREIANFSERIGDEAKN